MKKLFTIFGNPVNHSKSPLMHNNAFKSLGYDGCYGRYMLEDGSKLRETFLELKLSGANITVPHKEWAYKACDELDSFAKKVGSVNTIVYKDDRLYGYNTDAPGFLKAIEEFSDIKRVLFLGAGGTAKSTSVALRDAGYKVVILNRSSNRLQSYKDEDFECYSYDEFQADKFDLIVNMTSAGLSDDNLPASKELLEVLIPEVKACVDVIYGKETPFIKLAKSYNKPTKDGLDMLVYQGVIAFEHFTAYQYNFDEILPFMRGVFGLD
jgi:shikimate dehydrogenase